MITRSNLAEQLREYQIRSKHDWASVSFFSSTANITSRVDVVIFVIWELVILGFLVFSAVSLYFRHIRLAFTLVCIAVLLFLSMKITKKVRQARKKKRRMLLPLSMSMNMKQGYARVTGSANPPINAAKLGKKGSATDIKNAKHPNEALSPALSHRGHGLFNLRVYLDSRLSKTGIAYIWNEVRLLSTMSRLINPRRTFEVSCPWYLCKASNIPPFADTGQCLQGCHKPSNQLLRGETEMLR